MSAADLWQELVKDPKRRRKIKELLENLTAPEEFEILAARILLANEKRRETVSRPRLRSKTRKIASLEKDLDKIRTELDRRVQLPSEEEARYWLKQWREGAPSKQESIQMTKGFNALTKSSHRRR